MSGYQEIIDGELGSSCRGKINTQNQKIFNYDNLRLPIIDGQGFAITTGLKNGGFEVPYACVIVGVRIFSDLSCSAVIDLWKDVYANYPPTDADSITASAPPILTTAVKNQDTGLTGWTKTLAKGDIIYQNVDSNDNAKRLQVILDVQRS